MVASSAMTTLCACPICLDTMETPMLATCCGRSFCRACLYAALAAVDACPLCRAPLLARRDGPPTMVRNRALEDLLALLCVGDLSLRRAKEERPQRASTAATPVAVAGDAGRVGSPVGDAISIHVPFGGVWPAFGGGGWDDDSFGWHNEDDDDQLSELDDDYDADEATSEDDDDDQAAVFGRGNGMTSFAFGDDAELSDSEIDSEEQGDVEEPDCEADDSPDEESCDDVHSEGDDEDSDPESKDSADDEPCDGEYEGDAGYSDGEGEEDGYSDGGDDVEYSGEEFDDSW